MQRGGLLLPTGAWATGGRGRRSAHVGDLLFVFGVYFGSLEWARWTLRTRHNLAFSFLTCTFVLWRGRGGCSAHVKNLLFLFGVYFRSLAQARMALRTRRNLAFSFWRVLWFSSAGEMGAPHTPKTCFFFLACTFVLWRGRGILLPFRPTSHAKNRAWRAAPDSVHNLPISLTVLIPIFLP